MLSSNCDRSRLHFVSKAWSAVLSIAHYLTSNQSQLQSQTKHLASNSASVHPQNDLPPRWFISLFSQMASAWPPTRAFFAVSAPLCFFIVWINKHREQNKGAKISNYDNDFFFKEHKTWLRLLSGDGISASYLSYLSNFTTFSSQK